MATTQPNRVSNAGSGERAPKFRQGDVLSARELNRLAEAVDRLNRRVPVYRQVSPPRAGPPLLPCRVTGISGQYTFATEILDAFGGNVVEALDGYPSPFDPTWNLQSQLFFPPLRTPFDVLGVRRPWTDGNTTETRLYLLVTLIPQGCEIVVP